MSRILRSTFSINCTDKNCLVYERGKEQSNHRSVKKNGQKKIERKARQQLSILTRLRGERKGLFFLKQYFTPKSGNTRFASSMKDLYLPEQVEIYFFYPPLTLIAHESRSGSLKKQN